MFLLAQGSTTLYKIDLSDGTATALTLPSGVTLSSTRKPRVAVLNQWVIVTNSPTQNLAIDAEGTVRVLIPRAPLHSPTIAAGSGTGLTGAYGFRESFIVTNTDGELLMESPLSPTAATFTLANQNASLSDIPISLDTISARRIYRTAAGGTAYFHLVDLDGNTNTTLQDNTTDATLALLPAQPSILTAPPGTLPGIRMKQIIEWKSRLWGIADDPALVDTVFFTETNKVYAWPNTAIAYPTGMDSAGIVAFAKRKNQLGLLKRNGLWQISGSSATTGISSDNLSISQIAFEKAGCSAPDSVVTINDRVYYLGKDGVYEWGERVDNISNDRVDKWFQSDTYFNRSRFGNAFAKYDEINHAYELHLANAGDSTENRWVTYYIDAKVWTGPHKTDLFTPTHACHGVDENMLPIALVGASNGVIYQANASTYRDGAATAIDMDCYTPFFSANAPDIHHVWLQPSILTKIEAAGTLSLTPYVGRLDASAGTAISHDLTLGRERLTRLGTGPMFRFRIRQNTVNQSATIYGVEVPFLERGRR